MPALNLVVLRSSDIDRAVEFYRELGISFAKHAHGKGPEHHASQIGGTVFEMYPATEKYPSSVSTRIGFSVDELDRVVSALEKCGAQIPTPPSDSEWGRRAVLKDLDGHTVELLTPKP